MAETCDQVATIGYQGRNVGAFIAALQEAGIEMLVDVRRIPLSRKPGFSKSALFRHLQTAGIDYCHYGDLGMPRDLLKLKNDRDNTPIIDEYWRLLPTMQSHVDRVAGDARVRRICLMCFEADHRQCHRGALAEYLSASEPIEVVHL